MDIKGLLQKITAYVGRYKYAVAIVLIGVVLMTVPFGAEKEEKVISDATIQSVQDVGKDLSEILSKIKGVGRVEVLLTLDSEGKTIYQINSNTSSDESSQEGRYETVIITDSNRNQQGLIQQILGPSYRGAVVVCQGADDPVVKLAVMEAVKNATGLGYDKISVLKMK